MLNSILKFDSCHCTRSSEKVIKRLDLGEDGFMDKENMEPLSPMKTDELSFYENENPREMECTAISSAHCSNPRRKDVDDFDPNSQDSGYGTNYTTNFGKSTSYVSPSRSSRVSFGSLGSQEDDFLESMSDFEPIDENLPLSFNTLINGELSTLTESMHYRVSPQDVSIRPLFRRALSLQNDFISPNNSKVRSCLFREEDIRSFKRPEPPTEAENSPSKSKRTRVLMDTNKLASRPVLKRAFSASEESIKCAVQRSAEEDLIGDFSTTYSLPLTQGRHQDLKSITSHTLAGLIRGDYKNIIASFKVIDCRYPYEFNGGHIEGAINIFTKEQCLKLLEQQEINCKGQILIFHCEFSSERGPNLFRYLRQQDRSKNEAAYPSLQYPEIYLLEGGYKCFFTEYSHMCVPEAYKQMLHPEHEEDLRYFRMKSKTWNADSRPRLHRGNLKRLGL